MKSGTITLVGCCLATFVLGSIHAYSVFLVPLEKQFTTSRDMASLGYSIALASLTIAVLFGHHIFTRFNPATFIALICLVATGGAYIASLAASLPVFIFGYGVIFGTSNGLGYGFCLQLGARSHPRNNGLAMGLVTAAYAAGATAFPYIFAAAIEKSGMPGAMQVLMAALMLIAVVTWILLKLAKATFEFIDAENHTSPQAASISTQITLWIGYATAAGAGLMVIAHAHPIFIWLGKSGANALLATTIFAFGNLLGGVAAGWLSDHFDLKKMLIALPLLSVAGFASFLLALPPTILFVMMGLVGFCYGALIVVYPVAVTRLFGAADSPRIYGRIFTAWGLTGLFGPWLAGLLFELTGSYSTTLVLAALLGATSALIVAFRLVSIPVAR